MSEPKDLPGLAHFCEHMLFLGTKKYSAENEFTQFLTQNGGSYNAYTASDHTNYYYSIKTESLKPSLDRLMMSLFFINIYLYFKYYLDLLNFSLNHCLQQVQLREKLVLLILNMKKMLLMIIGV